AVRKMMRIDVPAHLAKIGGRMQEGGRRLAERHRLPLTGGGRPEVGAFIVEPPEAPPLMTLLTARMLDRGFLAAGYFNPMLAHEERHVDAYLAAADEVFAELRTAIDHGDVRTRLGTPV